MARPRRYGVDAVDLGVRISRRVRDRMHATVERGGRGMFVEQAIADRLDALEREKPQDHVTEMADAVLDRLHRIASSRNWPGTKSI